MYKIGELSRLCRIPVKTLRYYDNEGLLVADEIDRFTGYRYYSAACLRVSEMTGSRKLCLERILFYGGR